MQIEKGIPFPRPTGGAPRKYPFPDMEVGDSFAVPMEGVMGNKGMDIAADRVRCAACNYARPNGVKFIVRTIREDGVVRCWRVE